MGGGVSNRQNCGAPLPPDVVCLQCLSQHLPSALWPPQGGNRDVPTLTSSSGSSLSSGRELVSSPMRKGVGEHTMSIMAGGSTGM